MLINFPLAFYNVPCELFVPRTNASSNKQYNSLSLLQQGDKLLSKMIVRDGLIRISFGLNGGKKRCSEHLVDS